jgi:hypothetical protein
MRRPFRAAADLEDHAMPRLFGSPVLAPSGDGRLELFIFAIDGSLWHIWQTAWSNGWSGWASPGGAFGEWPAAIARNGDGRLITLAVGGALEQVEQTSWSNGWSGWTSLGLPPSGTINTPTVAAGADGRLILFASGTGQDGPPQLWRLEQDVWGDPGIRRGPPISRPKDSSSPVRLL